MDLLPLATRSLVNDQYISVSVPDTPRAVTAGGDATLAEHEACHSVLADQRDGFEHAAWMFQAQPKTNESELNIVHP